jgi:SAM-dependent methyltransferase
VLFLFTKVTRMFREKPTQPDNNIDWGDVWNRQVIKRRELGRVVGSMNQWQTKQSACRYWESALKTQYERIADTINEIEIFPNSRILDIGAGPGVLAIPLAHRVAHITAVEPLTGMVEALHEKILHGKIKNINWIQKYWEDIDVSRDLNPPYDLVLASLSLNMLGIREAILKMVEACSNLVYLYWFAGEPSWEIHSKKLIPLLHQIPFVPMPKSDILFNILVQMGIHPHIKVFDYRFTEEFSSFRELLDDFVEYYQATTRHQENIIKKYLRNLPENSLKLNGKSIRLHSSSTCVKIWWKKY